MHWTTPRIPFPTAGKPGQVLDIRADEAFRAGHLPGAVSIPVAPPEREADLSAHLERVLPSIFLPPREVPLLVVGAAAELATAVAAHLQERGRTEVIGVAAAALPGDTLSERGATKAHLWRPPAWLEAHVGLLPPPVAGPVLDLACGSGRAAVWLAERGYRVTAIDHQPEALAFGRMLADSRHTAVHWVTADLRRPGSIPPGPWAIILDFRYLRRDLLDRMVDWLAPGGVALVRTFRAAPGYAGHPQPRHRLGPGELLRSFPRGRCEILVHEESHDPDGRPAAGIVARRKSSAGT